MPMGGYGSIEIKVVMDSIEEEDTWLESNFVRLKFNLTNPSSVMEIQNQSLEYSYQVGG